MKYRDLIAFDPIQSVKVLTEASALEQAREDVSTFVISDRMLELIRDVIVPNLRLDRPTDAKGLLVVANYGTGKTHLMSVLSAVAEHAELTDKLTRPEAAEELEPIAGTYRVIREEIGASTMSLRDIVCTRLQTALKEMGVDYEFPPLSQVSGTKDSLQKMMAAFEAKHGQVGLLFVLDELLDHLRGRRDTELNLDLRFLREVGEICRSTRFRIICGIQEAIFDNPRFSSVASEVNRVRDRFEQARISREDVAFVVQERLLKKNLTQKDWIRHHLQAFTPLYEGMAEHLEDFVALFPVHPAYLRTFEQISAVEKREVLRTLSREMADMLDRDVADDVPGLLCYDSYRARLADEPSFRTIPEVREVLEKTQVLRNRTEQALASRQYVPTALRIIDGLSIHRLTTADIHAPIGALPTELRDDLCLLPPDLPEKDAFFLEVTIKTIIDQIIRAVSGQFIAENPESHQLYIDLRKDIDYDQQIQQRAESLDDEKLDSAYFIALEEVLERRDQPYVSGYRIWQYELPWTDHRVTRIGYLFLGAPNQRSTAQPPRDFYIYFLQPYDPPDFTDEEKADEVFFRLESPDEEFTLALRRYAGATAKANESTADHRAIYFDKAKDALTTMTKWLRGHMGTAMTVTYRGERKPLEEWLAASPGPRTTVKEKVDTIAGGALRPHFEARYPGYPVLGAEVTSQNLELTVKQCLNQIATSRKTDLSSKILQSLGLVDLHGNFNLDGNLAQALLDGLKVEGGKAVLRDRLLQERDPGVWTWPSAHLEPAWLVVVAAVLVQLGRAEIGFTDGPVDALGLDRLSRMSLDELEGFTHVAPPKQLPVLVLREVAKVLSLPPGIVSDQGVDQGAVQQLLTKCQELLQRVSNARDAVQARSLIWGALLIDQPDERDKRLQALQKVLENVGHRTTVGMMNKVDLESDVLDDARAGKKQLERVEAALSARTHLDRAVTYLQQAVDVFGEASPLAGDADRLRDDVLALFAREDLSDVPQAVSEVKGHLEDLADRFAEEAIRAHRRDRLDGAGDERKRSILEGPTYRELALLSSASILPGGTFGSLQKQLAEVGTCKTFDEAKLHLQVICPECGYRPRTASGSTAMARVEGIESQLDALRANWAKVLSESLAEPQLNAAIDYLDDQDQKASLRTLADQGEMPDPVTDGFVRALNQVLKGFEVRRVAREEVWGALFPTQSPATRAELVERFGDFLTALRGEALDDKLRIVPAEDHES